MTTFRWLAALFIGGVANAAGMYLLTSVDPRTSPPALLFFAAVGAIVAVIAGRAGWLAAPLAFYIGLAVIGMYPRIGNGTPSNFIDGYRLSVVTFAPLALVAVIAGAAAVRLNASRRPGASDFAVGHPVDPRR